jgi:DNA-binding transcriptional ArsR family regulator
MGLLPRAPATLTALFARRLRAPAHRQVDSVFGALADPTRRRVVETLARGGTVTASGLAEQLPITRQAVAKHLSALSGADLVTSTRVGRELQYRLRPQPLDEAAQWIQTVSAEWDDRLEALRRSVENRAGSAR